MRAPTGTGKTLAYLAPIVDGLAALVPRVSRGEGCHALIITPTRELTLQVLLCTTCHAPRPRGLLVQCLADVQTWHAAIGASLAVPVALPASHSDHSMKAASEPASSQYLAPSFVPRRFTCLPLPFASFHPTVFSISCASCFCISFPVPCASFFACSAIYLHRAVLQVYDEAVALTRRFIWLLPGLLVGGENRHHQKRRLRKGITILVATPGRLLDHLEATSSFITSNLAWLVLDEADRLLDMGFEHTLKSIMSKLEERSPDTRRCVRSA